MLYYQCSASHCGNKIVIRSSSGHTFQYKDAVLSIKTLRPRDAILHQIFWSTLFQVMACYPDTTSHYLNQC